ncbi:peptidylprolyl isomerase [Sulfurovum sp.]|jgi:FKBP-type peptidyl-prolyl cis-trans isomerase SlyD|uniref:FKBP-type peptidyl-prolyl cis-trans isomerase n=1 Tax=Sulfurovum sp. TaxID=1969726 RepID=UPI002A3646A8|nr:peptidylprolyl isomerase [Sulfurovum sp.]MDY0403643.1 peptidylprolyl isomerase [Sulfurovum sp.]
MKITKDVLVCLEYRITDEEGECLNPDDSELIYLHGGYDHVFSALETCLEGKEEGDLFKATFTPDEAFGLYRDDLLVKVPLNELPEDIFVGMEMEADEENEEEKRIYLVTEIEEEYALLDANHPFAGLTLTFEGEVTELQELSEEAIEEILAHVH